jgi:hypothetical protein
MPSPKAIQEFKELYLRRYGVVLSDAEATDQAARLLRLYKAVYGPQWADAVIEDDETNFH